MGYNDKAAEVRNKTKAVRQKKIEKYRKKCLTNEITSDKIDFAAEKAEWILEN